jgi:hypothetical protein
MRETRRFPEYDVLAKRETVSWNDPTREVVEKRLRHVPQRRFFCEDEWRTLQAVCERVLPQPDDRPAVPIAAMIDAQLCEDHGDGYRIAGQPPMRDAWRLGLQAIDEEARLRFGSRFVELAAGRQDDLLYLVQRGEVRAPTWHHVQPAAFFTSRLLHDVVTAYYAFPAAWNELGFGGPASPRGYVRLGLDRRDPWEAEERRRA